VAPEPKDLLLYLGCNVLRTAHLAKTVIGVLKAMGFDFNTAGGPAHCCGIVHYNHDDRKSAHTVAANSMRHFARYGATKVLMWCPSCNEHYDEVVTKEQAVPFPYEHVTAFIARHLDRITFARRIEKRVAMHYHTGYPQSDLDWENTRRILLAIPGVELIDIENPAALGRHCAPKWIGRIGRPQWQKAISGVFDAARDARVDILATLYHSCHREICQEEAHYPFEIVNYISLIGQAIGIEHRTSTSATSSRATRRRCMKRYSPTSMRTSSIPSGFARSYAARLRPHVNLRSPIPPNSADGTGSSAPSRR